MRFRFVLLLALSVSTWSQVVPTGVILVKGAWSSASDSTTPLPEGGRVTNNIFVNQYFGMTYALPPGWTEKYEGPPPSDSGHYVLAQIDGVKGSTGSVLITAQDMFFTPLPVTNIADFIRYSEAHLQAADYEVDISPMQMKIANHSFGLFEYWSPAVGLHWYVLATEIRCHVVQFVLASRDVKLLKSLIRDMDKIKLENEYATPVCVKDYARDENVITRVNPIVAEQKNNPIPIRIIIGKDGKIKHIHFLSVFPGQAKAITDAMKQWKFKRYLRDGQPAEVETGIMFGRSATSDRTASIAGDAATE